MQNDLDHMSPKDIFYLHFYILIFYYINITPHPPVS